MAADRTLGTVLTHIKQNWLLTNNADLLAKPLDVDIFEFIAVQHDLASCVEGGWERGWGK